MKLKNLAPFFQNQIPLLRRYWLVQVLLILVYFACNTAHADQSLQESKDLQKIQAFVIFYNLGNEQGKGLGLKNKVTPEFVEQYLVLVRGLELKRAFLDRSFKEYTNFLISELARKKEYQNGQLRTYGNHTTHYSYYSLVKNELLQKIPENVFVQGFERRKTQFNPIKFVNTEYENVVHELIPKKSNETRLPSTQALGALSEIRMRSYFNKILRMKLPSVHIKTISDVGVYSNWVAHDLANYREFRRAFLLLDPSDTYGIRPASLRDIEDTKRLMVKDRQSFESKFVLVSGDFLFVEEKERQVRLRVESKGFSPNSCAAKFQ